jgi:uncharacterized membrane protein
MEEYQASAGRPSGAAIADGWGSVAGMGFLPIGNGMDVRRGVSAFAPFRITSSRAIVREELFMNEQTLAHGLGWFSIGLGAAILIAPRRVAQAVGVENKHDILQLVGVREIITGIGILSEDRPARWLWGRVVGDALDIALLASAPKCDGRVRASIAMAAVGGMVLIDTIASVQHSTGDRRSTSRNVFTGEGLNPPAKRPVVATITINRPAEEIYRFWRNFENLPRFMSHLLAVTDTGDGHSHWMAKGPAGTEVEWDAEITEERPNELISWRSLPGSKVENSGTVRFEPATGGRGTVLHVELHYRPPGGVVGATIAKLFGEAPEKQIPVDLMRVKQLLETGEIASTAGQPAGRTRSTSRKYDDWLRT